MQEIITYLIGLFAIIIIGRWLWRIMRGQEKGGCTSCKGCKHLEGCSNENNTK